MWRETAAQSQRDCIIQPRVASLRATLGQRHVWIINSERVESVPHVPLVECNFISFQQKPELILKGNLSMMLLLPLDIIMYRRKLREADGENAITVLPRELPQIRTFVF